MPSKSFFVHNTVTLDNLHNTVHIGIGPLMQRCHVARVNACKVSCLIGISWLLEPLKTAIKLAIV